MARIVSGLTLAATLLLPAVHISFAQTPPQIVKERQDGMEQNWKGYFRDISLTMRSDKPDLPLVATKATGASAHLKKLETLFPPGTGRDVVPQTRAKPDIWTKRAEFEATFKALIDATDALASAAKAGNVEKVKVEWKDVSKACGGCHGGPKKSGGKFRFEQE